MSHYLRIESRLNNVTMYYKKGKNGFHPYPFGRVGLSYEDAREVFQMLFNEPRSPYRLPKYVRTIAELKPLNLRINDPYTWDKRAEIVVSILDGKEKVLGQFQYLGIDGNPPSGIELGDNDDQSFSYCEKNMIITPE